MSWDGHARGSRAYRRILAGLFFAGVSTFAQLYSPQALLPEISAELGVEPATAALTLSVATLGLAAGVLPWSVLADRLGRVRSMVISLSGASLLGLLVPFAPSIPLLLGGRFLEGAFLAGVPAAAIAFLQEEIRRADAGRAAGIYVAGTSVGGLLGRVVAGPVGEAVSWRVGMLTVAVLCALSALAFTVLVPRPRGFARPEAGSAAARLGHRLTASIRSPRLLTLYAQGFLLMGAFVALYNYLGFRLIGDPFWLPQIVVSLIFFAYLAGTLSASRAGAFATRWGWQRVLVGSAVVMAVGVLLTLVDSLPVVFAGLLVATAGFFAAHAVASGWTGREATVGRAQAASLYNLAYYAGSSLFGWLGGVALVSGGWGAVVAIIVALVAVAAVLAALVLRD
ncbi:MFS transporter [Herbiconiux moechotypicola]|uniref:MFS transporter n=1 Tax=Herbiconiux moechotypicola TaxID=637393 RepID=A0ABN3DYY5_9MICO|nr:MFS transporter [Herbiconiux moechotypicola]MCS5731207.1 MFS transporter [Herbiconiux moechotypicola]